MKRISLGSVGGALDGLRERLAASELGQQAWARYERASAGQQTALQIGGTLLLLALLLVGIVWPLHEFSQGSQARYREQLDTLAWMEANRHRVAATDAAARDPDAPLLATVTQSAGGAGLPIRRYEPAGENGLNLWLDDVPFDALVRWLEQLERDHQVVAADLTVRRRADAGMVDVRITLEG